MLRRDFLTRLVHQAGLAATPKSAIATVGKREPPLLQTSLVEGFQGGRLG